ncbi:MAG: hypothetical protein NXI01_08585 [Gammaproteobacteria bacterium]|nr:hypothetical protein [Gammaproteobacteria bacterium]
MIAVLYCAVVVIVGDNAREPKNPATSFGDPGNGEKGDLARAYMVFLETGLTEKDLLATALNVFVPVSITRNALLVFEGIVITMFKLCSIIIL